MARSYFNDYYQTSEYISKSSNIQIIYIIILFIYFCGLNLYIFLFCLRIGSKATNLWLQGSVISLCQDILLLQPFRIWLKWIVMTQTIENIRYWHEMLRKRTKTIMLRNSIKSTIKSTNNWMNDSKALIQRFNPSCRVARKFPQLAASRLLMTLNDYDLPIHFTIRNNNNNKQQLLWKSIAFIIITIFFTLLPDLLRDTVIESTTNAYVNGLLLVIAATIKISIYIPIFIIIGIFILFIIYQIYKRKKINKLLQPLTLMKTSVKKNENNANNIRSDRLKFNTVLPQ